MARRTIEPALLALGLGVAPAVAHAYPQWQFSSGTSRCNQCHFAPAGGGLHNGYGRDASGEELSTWQGDGGFLHGKLDLPSWLALGLDGRGAFLSHHAGNPDGPTRVFIPMQLDAYGRAASGAWSASATVGLRGQARRPGDALGADNFQPASASRVVSREHYLMWRPQPLGAYVRAGRFFAPYGLRLAEHTTYVRRDTGFNILEETYGLSGGIVKQDWEVHLTGFGPDLVRGMGGREWGGAAMIEKRLGDISALGLMGRVGVADYGRRQGGGGFGKLYLEPVKTILMAEVDIIHNTFASPASGGGAPPASTQAVAYLGATVFPLRGLWLSAFAEGRQTDITVQDSATGAVNAQLNWFPYPHFELVLLGRMQAPRGQAAAKTAILLVHYYL